MRTGVQWDAHCCSCADKRCSLRSALYTSSQLYLLVAARAWPHPCLRVVRRQDLGSLIQQWVQRCRLHAAQSRTIEDLPCADLPEFAHADDGTWDASLFAAHNIGVNSISWAPAIIPSSLISPSTNGSGNAGSGTAQGNPSAAQQQSHPNSSGASPYVKKFATGGCDNLVKIWAYNGESQTWAVEETLEGHSDWVRDVAFAPGVGLPRTYLASCGQDRTVLIWTQDAPGQAWNKKALDPAPYLSGGTATEGKFPDTVWRVSWSVTGNVLAVAAGDGKVSLWKEALKGGEWECVSEVTA